MAKKRGIRKVRSVTPEELCALSEVLETTSNILSGVAEKIKKEDLEKDPFLAETKTLARYAFDCHRFATNLENKWNLREFEKSVGQIKSSMELLDKLSSGDIEEDDE